LTGAVRGIGERGTVAPDGRSLGLIDVSHVAHEHAHVMHATVVDKRNRSDVDRQAVKFGSDDPSTPALWVGDGDLVPGTEKPPDNVVLGPRRH
jgi:hypothetical protein